MKTIEEFCETHHACSEGREWALVNCKDLQEVWSTARPDWLVWIATRQGVLTDSELQRFAIFCARSVEHLLTDERSKTAIDVAEKFLDGKASAEELEAASLDARAAATDPARTAVDVTTWATMSAADAAWATKSATDAAWVAWAAARAARAARAATWADQTDWLRENAKPTF